VSTELIYWQKKVSKQIVRIIENGIKSSKEVFFHPIFLIFPSLVFAKIPLKERQALISLDDYRWLSTKKNKTGEFYPHGTEQTWTGVTVQDDHVIGFYIFIGVKKINNDDDFSKIFGLIRNFEKLETFVD
jgi:hypothetical protein